MAVTTKAKPPPTFEGDGIPDISFDPTSIVLRPVYSKDEISRMHSAIETEFAGEIARTSTRDEKTAHEMATRTMQATIAGGGPGDEMGHIWSARPLRRVGDYWYSVDEEARTAYLQYIFIAPHARGKGYAKAALGAIHSELDTRGYKRIELNVFVSNPTALALYRAFGYRVESYCMARPLSTPSATSLA